MAMEIGAQIIDALLLGVGGRRRELQDFPVLGDVWARFAEQPGKPHDLLITPTWERPTGHVAMLVAGTGITKRKPARYRRKVAYLHGLVVASLTLEDLIDVAISATKWWDGISDRWDEDARLKKPLLRNGRPTDRELRDWIDWQLNDAMHDEEILGRLVDHPKKGQEKARAQQAKEEKYAKMETEYRQAAKLGLLLGVLRAAEAKAAGRSPKVPTTLAALDKALGRECIREAGAEAVQRIIRQHDEFAKPDKKNDKDEEISWNGLIFQVSLNRDATPAIAESVGAIKADAARALFSISCKEIGWAVLDSGIDQQHPAFWDYEKIWKEQEKREEQRAGKATEAPAAAKPEAPTEGTGKASAKPWPSRIRATYDFRRIRAIMSVDAIEHNTLVDEIASYGSGLDTKKIGELLDEIAKDRAAGKRVNWAQVRPLIERVNAEVPPHPHGTHVAGIIGAHWLSFKKLDGPKRTDPVKMDGVCPDITLYDFRVLGSSLGDSEFAVIAALQFARYLNDQAGYSLIHGVNMSLSIPHNVRNYACGRTQVCIEAESLTANGVVVVAAAGNRGFQQYKLADNTMFESYAASSITDPGNAEGVITVGATHRHWPHTYGVSFFSSRGPTGDGRLKPDLLAPGEKITSCIPDWRSDEMDGTSMAAPHVSGAAALLMARHQELQGQPALVKQILCDTATDLKRERSFQGHGMVDVLRAIQSV